MILYDRVLGAGPWNRTKINVSMSGKDVFPVIFKELWCLRADLNGHELFDAHRFLKPACLPVPPPRQNLEHREGIEPPKVATLQAAAFPLGQRCIKQKGPLLFRRGPLIVSIFIDFTNPALQ